jgi:hypothetical protein
VPFLKLTGIVVGGWLMAKSAAIAVKHIAAGSRRTSSIPPSWRQRPTSRRISCHLPPLTAAEITGGSESVFALPENLF